MPRTTPRRGSPNNRSLRLLLAAAALVLVGVFAASPAAHAAEEGDPIHAAEELAVENGATEIDSHCIEVIANGGSVDECHEAPNPILPETNEIIYGTIGFLVVFFFVWKKGLPAMKASMNARTEKIRGDIDAAEAQRAEADTLLTDYRAQLADAKSEGARIIEEARQTADNLKRDLQTQAEADIAELRQKNIADIEAAKAQAIADLRNEVAAIAIGAAERVVERSLDRETNTALVENFINQVGAGSQ